ncbi:hypothetical protein LTS18_004692 [Coniosporium uncinatum]|uniref:Uncharacterized protein n=1 Tax=Coniosporium uncinatum TaxID=93489 RepID=A0ACC3D5H8_9PEZI|nr:hypothetical protein LTS18_004692 [Coniosporium uncinatum]
MSDSASHHSTVGEKDRQMEGSTGEGERSGGPQTRLDRAEADIMSWQNKAFALEQEKNDLLKETATVKQKERELEEKLSNVISTWAKAAGRSSRGTAEHVLACAAEGASPDWAIVLEAQEDFPALVLPQMVSSTRPVYRNRLDDIEGNRMAIFVEHLSPPVHNDDTHPATNVVKLLHDLWRILERDLPEHIFAHAVATFVYLYLQYPCTEEYISDLLGLIAKKSGSLLTAVSRLRLLLIAEARGCAGTDKVADGIRKDGHLPQDLDAFSVRDALLPMGSILQLASARCKVTEDGATFACTQLHNHDWFVVIRNRLWEYVFINNRSLHMAEHQDPSRTGFRVEAEADKRLLKWGTVVVADRSDIPEGSQLDDYVMQYLEKEVVMAGTDALLHYLEPC